MEQFGQSKQCLKQDVTKKITVVGIDNSSSQGLRPKACRRQNICQSASLNNTVQ